MRDLYSGSLISLPFARMAHLVAVTSMRMGNRMMMQRFAMSFVLCFTAVSVRLQAAPWLAFGDIRGHFEPCGCDPNTDLGGLPRLDSYIRRERSLHPGLKILHLGNDYGLNSSETQFQKNISIQAGMSVIAPDVSLLNRAELIFGGQILPSLKYVLSNHKSHASSVLKYYPSVDLGEYIVYGIVEPFKGYSHLEPFDFKFWKKKLGSSSKKSLLLYSGSQKTLQSILKSKLFSEIVSSNDWPLGKEFGDEERTNEGVLVVYRDEKIEVLKTPLGGQGVLRSPDLQTVAPAQSLASALNPAAGPCGNATSFSGVGCQSKNSLSLPKRSMVAWIGKDYDSGVSDEMKQVVAKARLAGEDQMRKLIQARTEDLKETKFVGSEACQSCHAGAYQKWLESKHAHAFATIKNISRSNDPECVSCHVLGFSEKGGFVSESLSPQFINVQCENCHGPRKDHLANPVIKHKIPAKESCRNCHTPPHSPKFEFKSYWESIKH